MNGLETEPSVNVGDNRLVLLWLLDELNQLTQGYRLD